MSLRLAKAARFETPIHETNDRAPLAVVRIARGAAGLLPLVPLGVVSSARVGYGAISIVRTPLRNVGHPHPLRTSAIVMHTRMDGFASSRTERDMRVRSVAPPSARYLDRCVVEVSRI